MIEVRAPKRGQGWGDGAQLVRMLDAAVDERLLHSNPARTPSGKVGYLPSPKRRKAHRYLARRD